MAVAELKNRTPLAVREFFTADTEGVPALVVVVKATVAIVPGGRCVLAGEQVPVTLEGEAWGEDSAESSYKYEPETALFKVGTDVVVIGHAYAQQSAGQSLVGIEAGPLRKMARVFGARRWEKCLVGFECTPPEPFETVPLVWEECYGGRAPGADRSTIEVEPRNPVGKGFLASRSDATGMSLPRIEDPEDLMSRPNQRPAPAGFGFVSPHWQPRVSFSGTYDEVWMRERAPLLARDFDPRFYSAAPPGLISATPLRGDEAVRLLGLSPGGTLAFGLPGFAPPEVTVHTRTSRPAPLASHLDTIIVEPDQQRVQLTWRSHHLLPDGPHAVREIQIEGKALDRAGVAAP